MTGVQGISSDPARPASPARQPGATVAGAADPKAREAARELEATFLALLLKEMRQSLEPDGLFAGDAGDVQGGLFDLYLSKHLADAGGVGLAAVVERQLSHTTDVPPGRPFAYRNAARPAAG